MSIAVLAQVYEETRRLAIAGSNLAPGDFRLQKLIPALEKAGQKAPVFGKVAQAAQTLIDCSEKESAQALLDLSTLVSAILYTQGATGTKGKLKPLATVDMGPPVTGTSARVLKPLIEALTNTGSGRLEIIRDAHRRGAFRDIRLVNPALQAIDDGYREIGDFIADKVLPKFGKTIYPELRAQFDLKGKMGHVRRLRLMHSLDPAATRDLVLDSLENGSKEIKIAAMVCLEGTKDALPHLLEQAAAKAKDVRAAAYQGLAAFKDEKVVEVLQQALAGRDLDIATGPTANNPSPKLLKFVHQSADEQFASIFAEKAKTKRGKLIDRFCEFLNCFIARTDKTSVAFLTKCFDHREQFVALKGEGDMVLWRVVQLLVLTHSKPILKMIGESHHGLPAEVLRSCFLAAALTQTPKKVYDEYSPYLLAQPTRRTDPAADRKYEIIAELRQIASGRLPDEMTYIDEVDDIYTDTIGMKLAAVAQDLQLDPRWLDAAIEADELELVEALARPGYKPVQKYLSSCFARTMKRRDDYWVAVSVLDAMIKTEHPDTTKNYIAGINKFLAGKRRTSNSYSAYWFARLIPELPESGLEPLEQLIPSLPDHAADPLIAQLAERKTTK